MAPRNVWLSYQEWVLICEQLKDAKWHPFELSKKEIKHWKEVRKEYESADQKCFNRVNVYPLLEIIGDRNVKVYNALCRENYRGQDMSNVLEDVVTFAGFIINYDDKNCHDNVPYYQWEMRMNKVYSHIEKSDKKVWFPKELLNLFYQECMPKMEVAQ